MSEHSFTTETDEKYIKRQAYKALAVTFAVLSLIACLGLLVAWQTFVYLEAMMVICCAFTMILKSRSKHHFILEFEGAILYITNCATNDTYRVYDVPASDFLITQSGKELIRSQCGSFCGKVNKSAAVRSGIKQHLHPFIHTYQQFG